MKTAYLVLVSFPSATHDVTSSPPVGSQPQKRHVRRLCPEGGAQGPGVGPAQGEGSCHPLQTV